MISPLTPVSAEFESSAARAVGMLGSVSAHLQGMWDATKDQLDQTDLLYLSSMAQLAACRGLHFISDETPVDAAVSSVDDVADELALAHHLLVEDVTGLDNFQVLHFVDEVGTLCLEMRRYVERH